MVHLKIEAIRVFLSSYQHLLAIEIHNIVRRWSLMPFANHAMLAHWWKKSFTYWCKQLETFMARRRNTYARCQLWYSFPFAWAAILVPTSRDESTCETKLVYMGSLMTTLAKVRTPLANNKVSTCWHEDWRECDERICVCIWRWKHVVFLTQIDRKQWGLWKWNRSPMKNGKRNLSAHWGSLWAIKRTWA